MKTRQQEIYDRYVKRIFDFLLSLCGIIVLSPVMIIVAILVRTKLGSPVIFKQQRPGKNEKIFSMYKFRTMTDERTVDGKLLPDEVRLTSFGRKLRSTSLDELPELFNILKGDMSIVGPRPLLIQYLPYYTEREKLRHTVRPGLTGLAQINGRNYVQWDKRLEFDAVYVETESFLLDVRIVLQTFLKVVKREDISVDTNEVETNLAEEREEKKNKKID